MEDKITPEVKSDSLLLRVGLAAFGTILSLVMLEIAIRVVEPRMRETPWSDRPTVWHLPESSRENRDFFYPPAKAPGVFRIVVVGDSFTFGGKMQFDDTFPKRLERTLNLNKTQPKVEVLNWGVPGYATVHEVKLVNWAYDKFDADLVVLEITLNDTELRPYNAKHKHHEDELKSRLDTWLLNHWHTARLVMERYYIRQMNREFMDYYRDLYESSNTWGTFAKSIDNIAHMAEAHQRPVLAAIFPLLSHPLTKNYPFAGYHQKIAAKLQEAKVPYVDLFPFFKDIPNERLQVVPGSDHHPNEVANRIVADALYSELVARKFVPAEAVVKRAHTGSRPLLHAFPPLSENPNEDGEEKDEKVLNDAPG